MKPYLLPMLLLLSSTAFAAPSFDCAKARSKAEVAICESDTLSELDADLARAYKLALQSSPDAGAIKATQKIWLKEVRDFCEDNDCLQLSMEERIEQLEPKSIGVPPPQATQNFNYESPPVKVDLTPVEQKTQPSSALQTQDNRVSTAEEGSIAAKPFLSDDKVFLIVMSVLLGLFVAAIGVKKQATYFVNWLDFIVSTAGTFLILNYIPNVFVWLAVVVLCHFIVGLMINNFNFKRGLISGLGRSAGIFVFLGIIAAGILWAFSKSKGSSVSGRINNGEDPTEAIENDRKAQNRENLGLAVGVGATGAAFYWIDSHFIDNMNKE
jgi:uncharacterized protein